MSIQQAFSPGRHKSIRTCSTKRNLSARKIIIYSPTRSTASSLQSGFIIMEREPRGREQRNGLQVLKPSTDLRLQSRRSLITALIEFFNTGLASKCELCEAILVQIFSSAQYARMLRNGLSSYFHKLRGRATVQAFDPI